MIMVQQVRLMMFMFFVLGGLPYVLGLGNVSVNIQLKEKILVQTKLKF